MRHRKFNKDQLKEFIDVCRTDDSIDDIAAKFGMTPKQTQAQISVLRKHGVDLPDRRNPAYRSSTANMLRELGEIK